MEEINFMVKKTWNQKELKEFKKIISDKRQDKAFKEGNFKYEGKNKLIPQGHIKELR